MSIKIVSMLTCDRCGRTEEGEPPTEKRAKAAEVIMSGVVVVEFEDLGQKCRDRVTTLADQMALRKGEPEATDEKPKTEPKPEEPAPKAEEPPAVEPDDGDEESPI